MSEEEVDTSETMLQAEYRDGQLQIVEVTPFDRDKSESILPDIITADSDQKYMQILDPNKGLVQLDLLNLTLVKCGEGGEESYRLVTSSEDGSELPSDGTITCVLQSSDGEDAGNQDFVMVDGEVIYLQPSQGEEPPPDPDSAPTPTTTQPVDKEKLKKTLKANQKSDNVYADFSTPSSVRTPKQLLDRAKALQKAKALMSSQYLRIGKRGRRRAGELPPPHELLANPSFKLYLYSCKLCTFKCNAVKELQAHRAAEHTSGASKYRVPSGARSNHSALQCAKCPFRGVSSTHLMSHVEAKHVARNEEGAVEITQRITFSNKVSLNSKEVCEADVLVCGACGFESGDRDVFRKHIEELHGAFTI